MEIRRFKNEDIELDIQFSSEENTVWLTLDEMATLFSNARSTISYHVKNIYQSIDELNSHTSVEKFDGSQRNRLARKYDLDVITLVGQRTKSKIINIFYKWCIDNLNELRSKTMSQSNIIRFSEGKVSLDVNVSPKEDTVWLNQNQIATLFGITQPNVSMHIKNIIEEGELELWATHKDSLLVQNENGRQVTRNVDYYNLDMILSIGYRVKSKMAIAFRKWATNVLKQYLMYGYVIDENRTTVTNENFMNLYIKVDNIDQRLRVVETESDYFPKKYIGYENNKYESSIFLKGLIKQAKHEITLIDPYTDINTLKILNEKKKGVRLLIITSSENKLIHNDVDIFDYDNPTVTVKIDDRYHDRYIIIDDEKFYHLGASIKDMGKRFTQVDLQIEEDMIETLRRRVEQAKKKETFLP